LALGLVPEESDGWGQAVGDPNLTIIREKGMFPVVLVGEERKRYLNRKQSIM